MKSVGLIALVLSMASTTAFALQRAQSDSPSQAPSADAVQSSPAESGSSSSSYVIGASDVLTVTVWREPTLSGSILVRPDGMISMALLGDVQASGLTPLQLADQISLKLKKYIQEPKVSVVVTQIHSKLVFLLGEVGRKGPVEMTPGMTLLEAISAAGGVTDFANTKKMYVLRNEKAGSQTKIPVNYKEALKGNAASNIVLKPGDTIVVP
jgi:Periplasmic protein involved in polysaccharide export